MKIVLVGTNHSKKDEDIDVIIDHLDKDSWTLTVGKTSITVTGLNRAMEFLRKEDNN